jgi:hypothetical protein
MIQPKETNQQQCNDINITKETCIDFGRWLFHQGIEYYDDLSNGVNYTMENKQGNFTMSQMFEIYLSIQK